MDKYMRAALATIRSPNWPLEDAVHDYDNVYLKLVERLEVLLGRKPLQESRVLDLGCGYTYPNVALLHAAGVDVCGVDVESVVFRDGRLATFRQRSRDKGLLRAIYHAGPRYSGYRQFYAVLAALAHASIEHETLSLRSYDGRRLPFEDETFYAVCSNAVLEHVSDLPAFVGETARVLQPGGVADMVWHNFYSPSGGHRLSGDVARLPWGHVTGESPPSCFLNRKRPEEMRRAFERRLRVLRVVGVSRDYSLQNEMGFAPEGARQLSEEWRRKLPGLSDSLLTTRSYLIQAVKGPR